MTHVGLINCYYHKDRFLHNWNLTFLRHFVNKSTSCFCNWNWKINFYFCNPRDVSDNDFFVNIPCNINLLLFVGNLKSISIIRWQSKSIVSIFSSYLFWLELVSIVEWWLQFNSNNLICSNGSLPYGNQMWFTPLDDDQKWSHYWMAIESRFNCYIFGWNWSPLYGDDGEWCSLYYGNQKWSL
jgi:hypothetical protein